ncbi:M43 family zinc metalloprotease [Flexibacter flexilis]|nr:M43 family zinc metalloprotease [Flexibacter flexilis]
MRFSLLLIKTITLTLLSVTAFAQQEAAPKPCGTSHVMNKLFEQYPERKAAWLAQRNAPFAVNDTASIYDSVLIIPVVVHVIHNYGPENVSDAQIFDMMRIINEDFAKINSDTNAVDPVFQPIVGKTKVAFRLAQIDPDGNCTRGITRHVSALTASADDNVKDIVSWNTSQYFNIWVVRTISFNAGAYAYYPGTVDPQYEGVVCLASQFGSMGASSPNNFSARTMTHEIGHYFNLAHTWGDTNEPGAQDNCLWDDDVEDTPNTVGVADQGCNKNMMSCGVKSNVENYMDYSSCARMFTNGQVTRMRTALHSSIGSRNTLWTLENRLATGTNNGYVASICAPVADFDAATRVICSGKTSEFTPLIGNVASLDSVHYLWTFEGGMPNTSTEANPVITYNSAGIFSVKLMAYTSGGADSITKENFVTVNSGTAAYSAALGISESFEESSFPLFANNLDKTWSIVNGPSVTSPTWQRNVAASTTGSASIVIANALLPDNALNSIITPTFHISSVGSPVGLRFKMAFAKTASNNKDQLKVYVSKDCGKTWQGVIYSKLASATGTPLSTVGNTNYYEGTSFVPTASQWRTETVNINNYVQYENVRFKFEMKSAGGGNLYIDDVEIVTVPSVGTAELIKQYEISIAPNPTNHNSQLSYVLGKQENIRLQLTDLLGREIWQQVQPNAAGQQQIDLPMQQLSAGMYLLHLQIGNQSLSQKIIKN